MPPSVTSRPKSLPAGCPRLLVCDLDGTLLDSQGRISETTVAALRQAVDAGVELAIATGRRHSFAWKVLSPVGLSPETLLISSNGAITGNLAGERLHRIRMPVATARLLCRQLDGYRSSLIFTFDRTGPGTLVVENVEALHRRIPHWVDANRPEITSSLPLERAFESGDEPIQAMICGSLNEMEEAMFLLHSTTPQAVLLQNSISVHRTEYAARNLCIVDLLPAGCSKGSAVARLAQQRGIAAAEIAAIGDNMNDADMLAFAGRSFVMRNAAAELHVLATQHGWTVTRTNDEDGAAEAILSILEEARQAAANTAMASTALAD